MTDSKDCGNFCIETKSERNANVNIQKIHNIDGCFMSKIQKARIPAVQSILAFFFLRKIL